MKQFGAASDDDIQSIILFGSHARGDADFFSDQDVCVFTGPVDYSRLLDIREKVAREFSVPISAVAAYPEPIIAAMRQMGSLFLWHLHLEGKILHDRDEFARKTFSHLQRFAGYLQELELFEALLADIAVELEREGQLTEFDLHLLQTVIRDTCILMTYFKGRAIFGRKSALVTARTLWPSFPVTLSLYEELCTWHLRYFRGCPCDLVRPSTRRSREILEAVQRMVSFARELLG